MLFHQMSNFLQVLAEKFTKTPKQASLLEKLLVCAKLMIFQGFSRHEKLSSTFGRKHEEDAETC